MTQQHNECIQMQDKTVLSLIYLKVGAGNKSSGQISDYNPLDDV